MAEFIDSFPVCEPCKPWCPISKLDYCDLGFERPSTSIDDPDNYVLPDEHKGKEYKKLVETLSFSGGYTYEATYGFPAVTYTSRTLTPSGTATLTKEVDPDTCAFKGSVAAGSVKLEEKSYSAYDSSDPPDGKYDTVAIARHITKEAVYGAGQSIPNPNYDPNDPESEENLTTTASQGVYTHTDRVYDKGNLTSTTTTQSIVSFSINWFGDDWREGGFGNAGTSTTYTNTEILEQIKYDGWNESGSSSKITKKDWVDLTYGKYNVEVPYRDFENNPWKGTWHNTEITLLFTPWDYDSEDENSPQPETSVVAVVWNGAGTPVYDHDPNWDNLSPEEQQTAIDSWFTDWVDLPIDKHGTYVVSLKRSQCYHGGDWQ